MRSSEKAARAVWEERHKKKGEGTNGLLAGRFNLSDAMRHGIAPPDIQEPGVLIRGNRHLLFGVTANGKTWVLLYLAKQAIKRRERVMYLDSEMGARVVIERLKLLGVTAEEVDEYLYYFPFPTLDPQNVRDYEDALDEIEPELILFDSWAAFLSQAGLEENSNAEVESWAIRFLTTAKAREITSVVLDHTPREDDRERGASRKREHVDVAWSVKQTKLFGRDSVGEITLVRKKDRECWLPLTVKFAVGGGRDGFVFRPSAGMAGEAPGGGQDVRAEILAVLVDQFGEAGARHKEWLAATMALCNVSKATFNRHISSLTDLGLTAKRGEKYYPVRPSETERETNRETNRETRTNPLNNGKSGHPYGNVRPRETERETSDGLTVSPVPPPIRGDGETNHETGPLEAWLNNPPTWFLNQAAVCVRQGSPWRLVDPLAHAVANELSGRWSEVLPAVEDWLRKEG